MNRFKLLYFVIFIINLHKINAQISDKRLCVDEECKVPISHAKTLLRYSSPDSRILSFAPNADITIYSKSAGSREDLWGGEINGQRGYVPKHMVRETKILQKPTLLVDTEFNNDTDATQVPSKVEPDKVQEPYEVVDGTTIYLNPQENISPSSTDSPIQTTALPAEANKINEPKIEAEPNQGTEASPQIQEADNQITIEDEETKEINDDDSFEDEEFEDDEVDDEDEFEEGEEAEEFVEGVGATKSGIEENAEIKTSTESEVPPTVQVPDLVSIEHVADESKEEQKIELVEDELKTGASTEEVKTEPPVELKIEPQVEELNSGTETTSEPVELKSEPVNDQSSNSEPITEEKIQSSVESEIPPPNIETTTLTPEIEMPQPFVDSFIEVTENPLEVTTEEVKTFKETIPTLPPLGLFSQSNLNEIKNEVLEEKPIEEPQNILDEKPTEEPLPEAETVVEKETSEEPLQEAELDLKKTTSEEPLQEAEMVLDEKTSEEPLHEPGNVVEEIPVVPVMQETHVENVEQPVEQESQGNEVEQDQESKEVEDDASPGFFAGIMSFFGSSNEETVTEEPQLEEKEIVDNVVTYEEDHIHAKDHPVVSQEPFCDATTCPKGEMNETSGMDLNFNSDVFLYLVTTAISVIVFLFGYIAFDKSKREGPLVAKINHLEKEMLVIVKENQIMQEKLATDSGYETNDKIPHEVVESLKQELSEMTCIKNALEEQVQSLEKELENSTEVGMELNRMLSEILSSESGSDVLKANVEHLQRQLVEQQSTINSVNETLAITNTENHELRLEVELSNKKVIDLQAEIDKLLLNILKIEEEKETQQSSLETEIASFKQKYQEISTKLKQKDEDYNTELKQLKTRLDQAERKLELKTREQDVLTDSFKQLKTVKNKDDSTLQNLLEVTNIKAELQLLKTENQRFIEKLQQEEELKSSYEKKAQVASIELHALKTKYDEIDKLRVETETKLEVLSNYFKDRETQWQKEISKHEALWAEKEGEATSTTERIKFMQDQLQNYKAQTESLKQEIMSQEIELKSQISVLEKKAHENWVSARQAERKLEEAKQEAAQLRHRLTLRERALQEDKTQHRLQSLIEQNGDMPLSPIESPASPPLLYGTRDHITKSPPIPGLPPFLPPPPGVPFMPPPIHGVPPFIPPPPNMFPGDHRPPPLGRMSSPPLNSRYSPGSRGYSPYDRNSSSPSDSEYGTSPLHHRGYSPFNSRTEDRRDYKRPPPGRSNGRNLIKGGGSSGSGHSNESLEKISRQQSKV